MDAALERKRKRVQVGLAAGLLAGGGAAYALMMHTAPQPPRRAQWDTTPDVAVVTIEPRTESTAVVGHGTVRPKNQVDIVPLVSGKLINVHRNLLPGKVIPKGEVLFEIDRTIYEARVAQAEAEMRGLEASLARIDEEFSTLQVRLANARAMLDIDERDHQVALDLFEKEKVGTQRDVDQLLQKLLRQRDAVAELQSRLAMIPHMRRETQAKLDAAASTLTQVKHDLGNTRIIAPFRAHVEAVSARESQVVTAHFAIAKLTDMEAFEVSVGIDPKEIRWLDPRVRPDALQGDVPREGPPVDVSWSVRGQTLTWKGQVTRFERVDELTRTASMVVEVRDVNMTARVALGETDLRYDLAIGMFVRAALPAVELRDALVVPRHAIHDDRFVYVFESDEASPNGREGRLGRREIPILRSVGDSVVVDFADREGTEVCELRRGELVVLSPLAAPVDGMRIRLRDDRVAEASRAETPSRYSQRPAAVPLTLAAVGVAGAR